MRHWNRSPVKTLPKESSDSLSLMRSRLFHFRFEESMMLLLVGKLIAPHLFFVFSTDTHRHPVFVHCFGKAPFERCQQLLSSILFQVS